MLLGSDKLVVFVTKIWLLLITSVATIVMCSMKLVRHATCGARHNCWRWRRIEFNMGDLWLSNGFPRILDITDHGCEFKGKINSPDIKCIQQPFSCNHRMPSASAHGIYPNWSLLQARKEPLDAILFHLEHISERAAVVQLRDVSFLIPAQRKRNNHSSSSLPTRYCRFVSPNTTVEYLVAVPPHWHEITNSTLCIKLSYGGRVARVQALINSQYNHMNVEDYVCAPLDIKI